ncbi:MAG: hypothetical protein JWM12_2790 [Ilumatobacteraceae bacterium]|nr:hypothetical protein [Ilumatobacteraceae bacterium]
MGERTEELKREIEATRGDLGYTLDAIGDRVSPGRVIERRKNRITGGVRSAADRVMGKAHDLQQSVGGAADDAVGAAQGLPDNVRAHAQGAPLTAGVLAFATGFLIAAVIPPSDQEKQASTQLSEKIQPIKDEIASAGHDVVEHLKEPAAHAADELKSAAAESLDHVKASATDAARDTADQAREAAGALKQDTTTDA